MPIKGDVLISRHDTHVVPPSPCIRLFCAQAIDSIESYPQMGVSVFGGMQ
jgi:hypothetical protein